MKAFFAPQNDTRLKITSFFCEWFLHFFMAFLLFQAKTAGKIPTDEKNQGGGSFKERGALL